MNNVKIKKNDTVLVLSGKDRGKSGKVVSVNPASGMIAVDGVNKFKKHAKPSQKYPQGGIIDITRPVNSSNLMVVCPGCKKATRISFKNEGTHKRRTCKKCGEVVDAA